LKHTQQATDGHAFPTFDSFIRILVSTKRDRVDGGLAVWVEAQLSARAEARARRDFGTADEIRRALDEKGIVIEDTPGGTRWKQVR